MTLIKATLANMPNKKAILFLLTGSFFQLIHAQNLRLPLWPAGQVPNYKEANEKERWDTTGIVTVSMVQTPDIAVYLPVRQTATGQAVLICPGGAYRLLAYDLEGTNVAYWLVSKGIAAIVLKSRLPNAKSNVVPHLSPLMDAQRAIRMVRANAARWGIDKTKIGIMGFSAGGHLASTLATHFTTGNSYSPDSIERESSRPDFAVLVYPVITMLQPVMHTGSRNNLLGPKPDSALAKYYSNDLQVTANTPQTFLVHAMDDKAVPMENSLLFFQALKENNVPGELHIFPKGGHGFGLGLGKGEVSKWPDLCADWIKQLDTK